MVKQVINNISQAIGIGNDCFLEVCPTAFRPEALPKIESLMNPAALKKGLSLFIGSL